MITSRRSIGIVLSLFLFAPAFGQGVITAPEGEATFRQPRTTPSRVLAGVRGYSDQVVETLVRLAEHAQVLEQVAERVWAGEQPRLTTDEVPLELREAIELLNQSPDVLVLAATSPGQLALLRSLWSVAPDGAAMRLRQLRRAYEQAAREAAAAWQRALENDPVALGEYRDLLTRFCEMQQEIAPDFACVRVNDRRYYLACPPDEVVVHYASEVGLPASLSRVLAGWWSEYAPQHVDAKLTQMRAFGPAALDMVESAYDWPAQRRAAMWQPVGDAQANHGLGLVPVVLQPPADQPPAARLAWAVTEHARLWSPPMAPIALRSPDLASRPAFDIEEPAIVIEEAIPGPQTARRDDVLYRDIPDRGRLEYVLPPYTGPYYAYSTIRPYYYDPIYYAGSGYSVVYPSGVSYSYDPYYDGGVYLHGGYVRYGQGTRRTERVHYGGGRHYGHVSVSTGGQRVQRHRPLCISTRDLNRGRPVYRRHSSRPVPRSRGVYYRDSTGRIGRGSSPARTVRSGVRQAIRSGARQAVRSGARQAIRSGAGQAVRSGLRAIKSKARAIRSGARATRSGTRAIRPAPRPSRQAIRPPSRSGGRGSPSSGQSRGGGVRRR